MSTLPQPAPQPPRRPVRRLRPTAIPRQPQASLAAPSEKPKASARSTSPLPSSSRRPSAKLPIQPAAPSQPVDRVMPLRSARPLWLCWLLRVQRSSLLVTFLLIGVALSIYSSTVYTQQLWGKEYNKLKTMQRHERQMVAVGEALKTQLLEQADHPDSGLVAKPLDGMVVVPAAAPRPLRPLPVSVPPTPPAADQPLGY